MRKIYIIDNLDCANCAAKIEDKISRMPGIQDVSLTFTTRQLRVEADDPDALVEEMVRIARTVESEAEILPFDPKRKAPAASHHHHHHDGCCCGHDHEHHHDHDECCDHEHHHHDGDECCCGHDHEHHHDHDDCCDHEHHHHDGDECCCGHDHEHHHDHDDCCDHEHHHDGDECCCGHDHEHHHDHDECCDHDHHHEEGCSCGCGHEHAHPAKNADSRKREHIIIGVGAALFAAGLLMEHLLPAVPVYLVLFVASYLVLGLDVLRSAVKNLFKGNALDENFLMSVATLGAFAIGEYPEAVGVMLFCRIGEYFEDLAVARSRGQIMEAVDLRPEVVNLVDGDRVEVIPAEEAEVGDLVLVRPGDRIPLDGVVVRGESRLDTAPITGEPVPVAVQAGDSVVSGCVNVSGQLTMRVEKPLEDSMVTRILDSVENAAASKPQIQRFITRFARWYTPVVVILAILTALVPSLITHEWKYWIYTAMTFLVMSCPCALVLSVPLAFFSGIGVGSKKGILFKGGLSIEAMNQIKAVVMDKTGTLTKGDFAVQAVEGSQDLLRICASCEQNSTHPVAVSIVAAARKEELTLPAPEQMEEFSGCGIRAVLEGRTVLCGNEALMEKFQVQIPKLGRIGGTVVLVAVDGTYQGYLVVSDTLKSDAREAVGRLKKQGIATVMLTGDGYESAKSVAEQTGIDQVKAKLLPQEKFECLQGIRREKGAVMFVGDGINDAPVLAGADVGAAMGTGADAAIEAADVVFMTADVSAIPDALQIARQTRVIAWQNVIFALAIKILVMILGLLGHASMWMAVFADTGVAMLCVLNSIRMLYRKK